MKLKETPDLVVFPETHYLFVELEGPFAKTAPEAWGLVQKSYAQIAAVATVQGSLSLYKVEPKLIYRAGVTIDKAPQGVPQGFSYELFPGGDYLRFLLQGPYSDLPAACGRVFKLIQEQKIKIPPEAFYGERYLNDIRTTPEDKLETEILVPVVSHRRGPQ